MDAIILAAGNSTRFQQNKLLFPIGGKPMYQNVLDLLYHQKQQGVIQNVIVVSQYSSIFDAIEERYKGVITVQNNAPEKGISRSIRLGIQALLQLEVKSESCLFAVADQPFLTLASISKIEQKWQEGSKNIIVPVCGGKNGNPVIFSSKYYKELLELEGDIGGKQVLRNHVAQIEYVQIAERELEDIDFNEF